MTARCWLAVWVIVSICTLAAVSLWGQLQVERLKGQTEYVRGQTDGIRWCKACLLEGDCPR